MTCSRCGAEIPDGAATCPSCGARRVAVQEGGVSAASVPERSATAPGTRAAAPMRFELDVRRWSQTDRIVGVATLVLFISLFLPWFGVSFGTGSFTVDGLWHGYMYIVLLLSIAMLGYLVLRGLTADVSIGSIPHERLLAGAAAVNVVLTLIGFLMKPGTGGVGWRFGAFLALIAAVVAVAPKLLPAARQRLQNARR